jgi:hypothetical protein
MQKKLHLSSHEGMMRCPQNTQKPKLDERTTRGGQTKVKTKRNKRKGEGGGEKGGGGSHTRGRGQVTVTGVRQHETGMHPR